MLSVGIFCRLQLPFSVDAYTTESPNKLPMMLETEVFSSEPLHSVLHLAYHAFKAGGVGALLSHVCSTKEEPPLSQVTARCCVRFDQEPFALHHVISLRCRCLEHLTSTQLSGILHAHLEGLGTRGSQQWPTSACWSSSVT